MPAKVKGSVASTWNSSPAREAGSQDRGTDAQQNEGELAALDNAFVQFYPQLRGR